MTSRRRAEVEGPASKPSGLFILHWGTKIASSPSCRASGLTPRLPICEVKQNEVVVNTKSTPSANGHVAVVDKISESSKPLMGICNVEPRVSSSSTSAAPLLCNAVRRCQRYSYLTYLQVYYTSKSHLSHVVTAGAVRCKTPSENPFTAEMAVHQQPVWLVPGFGTLARNDILPGPQASVH